MLVNSLTQALFEEIRRQHIDDLIDVDRYDGDTSYREFVDSNAKEWLEKIQKNPALESSLHRAIVYDSMEVRFTLAEISAKISNFCLKHKRVSHDDDPELIQDIDTLRYLTKRDHDEEYER